MTRKRKPERKKSARASLTLGPVLYNWPPETWRDFYFRIADEAPIDTVVLGEAVCSKREPFVAPHVAKVIERLRRGGKEVVVATLALVTNRREMKAIEELAADKSFTVEANDVSALSLLQGRAHHVGLHVNVYNEGTLAWLLDRGATRVTLPIELSFDQIAAIASRRGKAEIEIFAFGQAPLALSARCYSARAKGLRKDNCQFVCSGTKSGLELTTLDDKAFLAVNGTMTMSSHWINLAGHLGALRKAGVRRFRLSPQPIDMVAVARAFRELLDGGDIGKGRQTLERAAPGIRFADGFLRGTVGAAEIAA